MKKTVLVTGGARGIGMAVVQRLAREDVNLAISYRAGDDAAKALSASLDAQGVEHALFKADLANPQEAQNLPTRVAERFGAIHALVNNAGITDDSAFMTMDRERYMRVLNTNLSGTVRLTGAALHYLLQVSEPAVVIVSSLGGVAGKEGQVAYATSKGALIGFTQWLGREYSGAGLRVNAVAPGFIQTDMVTSLQPNMVDHIVNGSALRRVGTAQEVADVVAFLLTPGYVQSTTLRVDGGFNR